MCKPNSSEIDCSQLLARGRKRELEAREGGGGEAREASQTKNREAPLFFSVPIPYPPKSLILRWRPVRSLVMNDQMKIPEGRRL